MVAHRAKHFPTPLITAPFVLMKVLACWGADFKLFYPYIPGYHQQLLLFPCPFFLQIGTPKGVGYIALRMEGNGAIRSHSFHPPSIHHDVCFSLPTLRIRAATG